MPLNKKQTNPALYIYTDTHTPECIYLYNQFITYIAQSAGAVEYTDCTSAEG